ncbi:hypothetical protein T35B1_10401 [Salinisphaera shabanensis T35B1]
MRNEFLQDPRAHTYVYDLGLFVSIRTLMSKVLDIIGESNGKIVFDISSLPKRFFFPITKILLIMYQVQPGRDLTQ